MPYKTVGVEVYIDLNEFSDEDILEEVERRDLKVENLDQDWLVFGQEEKDLLDKIYHNRRNHQTFDAELDQLIYNVLGRIL